MTENNPQQEQDSSLTDVPHHFSLRLKEIIGHQSVRSFARNCNISETALRKYLNATSTPNIERLLAIANYAKVTVEWLVTGQGRKVPLSATVNKVNEPGPCYETGEQVEAIEKVVLNKMIHSTQVRLENIQKLAEKSDTPDVWAVSIEMETKTLESLMSELRALDEIS